ncbi:MAG: hypothetical protein H2069_00890 [Legionella sp.]|nr:hypothetical protein [Legionella sp.]
MKKSFVEKIKKNNVNLSSSQENSPSKNQPFVNITSDWNSEIENTPETFFELPTDAGKVQAFSFDADGCLFHRLFRSHLQARYAAKSNDLSALEEQIRINEQKIATEKRQSVNPKLSSNEQLKTLRKERLILLETILSIENEIMGKTFKHTNKNLLKYLDETIRNARQCFTKSTQFNDALNAMEAPYRACFDKENQRLTKQDLATIRVNTLNEMNINIFLVGSSRQSAKLNNRNKSYHREPVSIGQGRQYLYQADCIFSAVEMLQKFFDNDNVLLNKLLLPDCFNNLPLGTTFKYTRGPNCIEQNDLPVFDHSKVLIIYAQAHELAQSYPKKQINLSLIDNKDSILNALNEYLSKTPAMLPHNVTLSLVHYNGKQEPSLRHTIGGAGNIDQEYSKTLRIMGKKAAAYFLKKPNQSCQSIDMTQVDPKLFKCFNLTSSLYQRLPVITEEMPESEIPQEDHPNNLPLGLQVKPSDTQKSIAPQEAARSVYSQTYSTLFAVNAQNNQPPETIIGQKNDVDIKPIALPQ